MSCLEDPALYSMYGRTLFGIVVAAVVESSDFSVTTLIVLNGISVVISVIAYVLTTGICSVFSMTTMIGTFGD